MQPEVIKALPGRRPPKDAAAREGVPAGRQAPERRYVPLLYRVAALNLLLMLATVAATVALLAPHKVSSFVVDEGVAALGAAIVAVVLANLYLLRRVVGPVQALTALARRVDLTTPGQRMPATRPASEAGELALTFNEMLSRLETERREATGRILAAQESERLRIAQELHDQVGQELTAVLLGLSRIEARAPADLQADVAGVQDVVRASIEDVRRIALELRPEALDELGLGSALAVLCERSAERLGLDVTLAISSDLPALRREEELVIYRVAQEALTNVARHSGTGRAELGLATGDRAGVILTVRDRGRGLASDVPPGTGIRGMRERAALIGASMEIRSRAPAPGCEMRLELPPQQAR